MEKTKEQRDKELLDDLRSHGGESAVEFGEEFLKMDSDSKLATVTVMGLRAAITTLEFADMMIMITALGRILKKEPVMGGIFCTSINEAVKKMIEERRVKRNAEGGNNEQESN